MVTETPTASFDLVDSPWLPVLRLDGTQDELSITEVFAQAPRLRRLVGDVPTQEFALTRLLLAILHDAVDGPAYEEDWQALWEADGLPLAAVTAYLDKHRDRFDLLHPRTPFFQVADLRTAKDEIFPLARIVADVPNGEPFFTMRSRGAERLGFAEAARWLVHAHAYDPSGIKSGAVGDPRVKGGRGYPLGVGWAGNLGGVLVEGDDLRQTLLLNLVATQQEAGGLRGDGDDRPAWRRDPCGPGPADKAELTVRPNGVRDLYTWQSRRVRLHHDAEGVHGVLLAYGDPLSPRNMHDREPMTAWRRSPAQEKKLGESPIYLPRDHEPARSAWRGLAALITGRVRNAHQRGEAAAVVRPRVLDWVARLANDGYLPEDHFIRARLIGAVYGTQQSVIDEVVDDAVTMAVVVLRERDRLLGQTAVDAVGDAEDAVNALGDLADDLARAAGIESEEPRDAARDRGFGELDGHFRDWLRGLSPGDAADPRPRHAEWQRTVRRVVLALGRELVDGAGEAAWVGRVVSTATGAVWLNASRADLRFRARLRKDLPLGGDQQNPEGEDR
ncbi:type I-E CRISPR-associated protein Cse1/CasA [Marinactinospora thermotolerans]|uniref:CRISPR-associated protein, Cse1 family n=1 Tax=Marinactinospora thermotolerans DSM 45154 TaxID=1122192 RepID=A0A1T4QFJ9_9ACTN|nr:type I-E CRISPR-associated protein Cse1/CasA [Marinactinospora thermotolerans]SKA02426.1 CRISPR-associated protein, Cse1 family [Marinactinospora thermotolerans DSM 45154]